MTRYTGDIADLEELWLQVQGDTPNRKCNLYVGSLVQSPGHSEFGVLKQSFSSFNANASGACPYQWVFLNWMHTSWDTGVILPRGAPLRARRCLIGIVRQPVVPPEEV